LNVVGDVEDLVVDGGVVSVICDNNENIDITGRCLCPAGDGAEKIERVNSVTEVVA
jgi:hypothetical protein